MGEVYKIVSHSELQMRELLPVPACQQLGGFKQTSWKLQAKSNQNKMVQTLQSIHGTHRCCHLPSNFTF